jgi:hypothetical protein
MGRDYRRRMTLKKSNPGVFRSYVMIQIKFPLDHGQEKKQQLNLIN